MLRILLSNFIDALLENEITGTSPCTLWIALYVSDDRHAAMVAILQVVRKFNVESTRMKLQTKPTKYAKCKYKANERVGGLLR